MEGNDKHWRGSPLDMAGISMDAYGIKEIVIEFDNGDEDILRPKQREEFGSYELHQMAAYLDSSATASAKARRTNPKRRKCARHRADPEGTRTDGAGRRGNA